MTGNSRTAKDWRPNPRAFLNVEGGISAEQVKQAIKATGLAAPRRVFTWNSLQSEDYGRLKQGSAFELLYENLNESSKQYARLTGISGRPTAKQVKKEIEAASSAARRLIVCLGLNEAIAKEMYPSHLHKSLPPLFNEVLVQTYLDQKPPANGLAEILGYIPQRDIGRDLYGVVALYKALESVIRNGEKLNEIVRYFGGPKASRSPRNILVFQLAVLYANVFGMKPTQDNKSARASPFVRFAMAACPPAAKLTALQIGEALKSVVNDRWFGTVASAHWDSLPTTSGVRRGKKADGPPVRSN
jgi:hypothetical protein